jgi:3-dehydroquinate dehydratase II
MQRRQSAGNKPSHAAISRTLAEERDMTATILILNGPNLNLLGTREPHIYGTSTLNDIETLCHARAKTHDLSIDFRQSNSEADLIGWVQEARDARVGLIINPAAYTFTSVGLHDALKMFEAPKIELHISNVHRREKTYHNSRMSAVADGVIAGLGIAGYAVAIDAIVELRRQRASKVAKL